MGQIVSRTKRIYKNPLRLASAVPENHDAYTRLHTVLGAATSLSTELAALYELDSQLMFLLNSSSKSVTVLVLRDNGIVQLLLQSLKLTGDTDELNARDRFPSIIRVIKAVASFPGGIELLAESGAVDKLTACIPHLRHL